MESPIGWLFLPTYQNVHVIQYSILLYSISNKLLLHHFCVYFAQCSRLFSVQYSLSATMFAAPPLSSPSSPPPPLRLLFKPLRGGAILIHGVAQSANTIPSESLISLLTIFLIKSGLGGGSLVDDIPLLVGYQLSDYAKTCKHQRFAATGTPLSTLLRDLKGYTESTGLIGSRNTIFHS